MEKYISRCRLILLCENMSKIIDPLQSRCIALRVGAPSREEITGVLDSIATSKCIEIPREVFEGIADKCGRNLRKAILMLESCYVQQ